MGQKIEYGKDARHKMYDGVKKVNDAVKVTLGPMGRCVVISELYPPFYEGNYKPIQLSKDGYRTAKSINLLDPLEHIGQRIIQEAAQKTVDEGGDATTTTCVLMEAILREGLKLINEGANPQELKKGIDKATEYVVAELKRNAIPVGDDNNKILQVATVSANNDADIGKIIADAFSKIGNDGVIDLEPNNTTKTEIRISDGFKIDKGWISPFFITNKAKQTVEFNDCYVLLYEKRINHHTQIQTAMTIAANMGKQLLIICEEIDEEGLAFLAINNVQKNFSVCGVKCPMVGTAKMEMMEDIAAVTGGTYISDTKGIDLKKDITPQMFGQAKKVIVTKDETIIIGGNNHKESFEEFVNELRMNLAEAKTEEDKSPIEKRIARLTGGIAVIQVGAATETEMKEKLDRYDDAVRATKSAIAEGIIVGGGVAFLRTDEFVEGDNIDIQSGQTIVYKAIKQPLVQICSNAGKNGDSILTDVLGTKNNFGYNAKTDKIEDLFDSGIVDAVKVLRCAIQNAASAAGNILISEAVIADTTN